MLKSVREEGSGWLGTGEDQSSDAAFGLGEEQLAKTLANSGGFGLSKLIDSGLKKESAPKPEDTATTTAQSR
jgi:Rod binding domain-containing protein